MDGKPEAASWLTTGTTSRVAERPAGERSAMVE
jgi:hypothetical protein